MSIFDKIMDTMHLGNEYEYDDDDDFDDDYEEALCMHWRED